MFRGIPSPIHAMPLLIHQLNGIAFLSVNGRMSSDKDRMHVPQLQQVVFNLAPLRAAVSVDTSDRSRSRSYRSSRSYIYLPSRDVAHRKSHSASMRARAAPTYFRIQSGTHDIDRADHLIRLRSASKDLDHQMGI